MESYKRPQSNIVRWLILSGAAVGTLLLVFVSGAVWPTLPENADPAVLLSLYLIKQALTVALLLIVPALWARSAHISGLWTLPFLSAAAFGFAYLLSKNAVTALYSLLLAALPGIGLYFLQRLRLSNFRTVIYESVLVLFALFGFVCLPPLIESGDAYLPFKSVIALYERILENIKPLLALEGGEDDRYYTLVRDVIAQYRLNADVIGVPTLLLPSMCAGLSNVLFSHLFNRKGGAEIVKLPPFANWRCERLYVFLSAGAAVVTWALAIANVNGMEALSGAALLAWRFPCALAGLSAIFSLSLQLQKKWIFVIVCCATLLTPTFGPTLLSMIGMLASIRRPVTDRKDGTLL
jgi:hypothetical protein